MATYVILCNWTAEGARTARDTVTRSEAVRSAAHKLGGEIQHIYWTLGRYDVIGICEAPDDETAAAIGVAVASSGAVSTETLRAFDAEEMAGVLAKLG